MSTSVNRSRICCISYFSYKKTELEGVLLQIVYVYLIYSHLDIFTIYHFTDRISQCAVNLIISNKDITWLFYLLLNSLRLTKT